MTRPADPRGASRRGATDSADLGHVAANEAVDEKKAKAKHRYWPAPWDIAGINAYSRQRAATGRCVVCGQPTDAPGVTCKATACLSCWVLGHGVETHSTV